MVGLVRFDSCVQGSKIRFLVPISGLARKRMKLHLHENCHLGLFGEAFKKLYLRIKFAMKGLTKEEGPSKLNASDAGPSDTDVQHLTQLGVWVSRRR
jgi:hypothetical protein